MDFPSDELLREIGRVCAAFSELEANYVTLIELLTDVSSKSGAIIASQLSFRKMLDVVSALFLHHCTASPHQQKLKAILTRSAAVEARRNTIIHSYYFVDDTSPARDTIRNKSTIKRSIGLRHQREIVTPAMLRQLSDDLVAAANEVDDFVVLLMGEAPFKVKLRGRRKPKLSQPTRG